MRIVIQERDADDKVVDTVILHLHEPEGSTVTYEEVEDDADHWANTFKTWRYNVTALRQVIVTDASHRRQRWFEKNVQKAQGEEGV